MVISVEEWKGWEWGFGLGKVYRRMNLVLHRWQCILRRQEIGFPNSKVLFLFRLLYNIEQSSLCYTIGPCWLSVVKFFHEVFFFMWTIFKVFTEFVAILFLFYVLVFWPGGMWDLCSSTRDQTCPACIGRQSLNHWTTSEVQVIHLEYSSVYMSIPRIWRIERCLMYPWITWLYIWS